MNIQEMNQAFERAYIQEFGEIDGVVFFNGEKYELFPQARGFAEFHLVELKINAAWTMWQQAIKCVVSETMAIVPKLLSDEKADELAAIKWQENLVFFKSQNRDLSLKEVEEYRDRWCRNKVGNLQQEYKYLVEAQGPNHE